MSRYAQNTEVPTDRSKAEIEATLRRYGACEFLSGWHDGGAAVAFKLQNRRIRFTLPLPNRNDDQFIKTPTGKDRSLEAVNQLWEKACRQRWRALALCIKAKLEAVACEISTFDSEFLAHIILPGNKTFGETFIPQIEQIYETKQIPKLMLEGPKN
jgi:hypothetical protein